MSNLWLRIKIWSKVVLVAIVLLYVGTFVYENQSETAKFWYWPRHQPETTLLLVVVCAFFAGVVVTLLLRTTFRTIRQIRDLQERSQAQRRDRQIADIHSKAAMLQTKPPAKEEQDRENV